jgi:hypothetical protein
MFGRGLFRVLALLVVVGILAGIGVYVYNAGVAQGLAAPRGDGGSLAPYPYAGPYFYPRFGFGWLFCLLPLIFFFLFPLFGWRRWGWGGRSRGDWEKRIPPMFEEWHRRAHEPQPERKPEEPSAM